MESNSSHSTSISIPKVCRICLDGNQDEDSGALLHPCRCSGTMRWVHAACAGKWLAMSGRASCELCGADYAFSKKLKSPNLWSAPEDFWRRIRTYVQFMLVYVATIALVVVAIVFCFQRQSSLDSWEETEQKSLISVVKSWKNLLLSSIDLCQYCQEPDICYRLFNNFDFKKEFADHRVEDFLSKFSNVTIGMKKSKFGGVVPFVNYEMMKKRFMKKWAAYKDIKANKTSATATTPNCGYGELLFLGLVGSSSLLMVLMEICNVVSELRRFFKFNFVHKIRNVD